MKKDKKETPDFIEENEDGSRVFNMTGTVHWPLEARSDSTDQRQLDLPGFEKTLKDLSDDNDILPLVLNGSSGNWALEAEFALVLNEAFELFKRKHKDYGPQNLSRFGLVGIIVRLSDKVARLENLMKKGIGTPNVSDESLRDTFIDILNYAAAAIVMLEDKWPNGDK